MDQGGKRARKRALDYTNCKGKTQYKQAFSYIYCVLIQRKQSNKKNKQVNNKIIIEMTVNCKTNLLLYIYDSE